MNDETLARRRFETVGLAGPRFESPEQVVGWFGAVQSQDYGPAKWAVGQRIGNGITDADIDRAFNEGRILRTHVLRPTWHFVLPEDIGWLLRLTGPRVHAQNAYYVRQGGLGASDLDRAVRLITAALAGGNWLTRKELTAVLRADGIDATGIPLAYIFMHAELEGLICSGPMKGKQHTYALLAERAPNVRDLSAEDALAEIVLRYFTSHGPATVKDLSWWSSLTLTDIRAGLAAVGDQLTSEIVDGVTYWFAPAQNPAPSPAPEGRSNARVAPGTVQLLQPYDEYVVGYTQSKHLLSQAAVGRAPTERTIYNGVVLGGTQVLGHWKRTITRSEVIVDVGMYRPFDAAELSSLSDAVDAHGAFLGLTATLGSVS